MVTKQKNLFNFVKDFLKVRDQGLCPFCKCKVNIKDFKDRLSIKEYRLSGLCQKCQDETFK